MRHELYDTRKKKSYVQLTILSITKREECLRLLLHKEVKYVLTIPKDSIKKEPKKS